MLYMLLFILTVIVITVLSLTVFFNIDKFEVAGNSHYSADEIIAASGMSKGQNMFRLNKFKIIDGLGKSLPYLSDVSIRRKLPATMQITVTESKPFGYILSSDRYYIINEHLKVLEITSEQPEGIPEIIGAALTDTEVGDTVKDENNVEQTLLSLTESMTENFGSENVTSISVENSYEIAFTYENRVSVLVGTIEKIDEKLKLARYVIDENASKENAEIDVTNGKMAYYRSVSPAAAPTEEQEGEKQDSDEQNGEKDES